MAAHEASGPVERTIDLAAYLPPDRRRAIALGIQLPDHSRGTALVADLSGFVQLSHSLIEGFGRHRGAEELTATLDRAFGALIAESDRRGGSVIGFSGDALTAWFHEDAGERAALAGIAMRDAIAVLDPIPIPSGSAIRLGVKVAVVGGTVRRLVIGDPQIRLFDVICGSTVDHLAAAAEVPRTGEIVIDEGLAGRLGERLTILGWRTADGRRYALLDRPAGDFGDPSSTQLVEEPTTHLVGPALRGWLPAQVFDRLSAGGETLLSELRPAVSVFLRFGGLDFDRPESGARLDAFTRWVEQVIELHGGTVVDVTIGEKGSFMSIVFGAPVAHGDDPLRAVAAANTLRTPPADLALGDPVRIGIARGRMCVGVFGGPTRRTYGVQGIEVSVAARLMQRAEPGQVVVSERVAKAIAGRVHVRSLGALPVKGLVAPVEAFELAARDTGPAGRSPSPTLGAADTPFVGRVEELNRLRELVIEVTTGEARAAVVRGEPGVGKSRLAAAFVTDAAARGFRTLRAAASPIDTGSQYAVWRSIFGELLDISSIGPDRALERSIVTLAERDRDRAALLGAVLPVAPAESDATRRLDPAARQDETQRLLVDLLVRQRGDDPLLIVLDDVQWLDSASWALLRRLVRALDRVIVLAASRADAGPAEAELNSFIAATNASTIDLAPLPAEEAAVLVREALRVDAVPEAVARFIAARAEGQPLYTLELAYALRDAGVIEVTRRVARLREGADLERLEFPESIEGLVTIRVDRLVTDAQDLLKVASVISGDFSIETISGLAAVDEGRVAVRLAELVEADLIVPAGGARGTFAFRHALIRDAVYGRLLFAQRRRLHRLVAERLERGSGAAATVAHAVVAYHWEAAGAVDRAIPHLEAAGDTALRDGAFPESARLLGRALELADAATGESDAALGELSDPPMTVAPLRRARWLWLAAQATYRLGELDRSRSLAEAALGTFDRPLPRGRLRTIAAIGGQTARQLAHRIAPTRFVGTAGGSDLDRLRYATRAYFNLAEVYYLASRQEDSALAALRGLNLAEKLGPSRELVEAYGAICIIGGLLGRQSIADRYARLGLAAASQLDDPFAWAIIRHQVGLYRSGTGPAEPLLTDFMTAIEGFVDIGDKGRLRDCLGIAAIAAYLFGRTDVAERQMTELLGTHADGERSLPQVWAQTWLGAIALRRGQPERAIELLEQAASTGLGAEGLDMTSISLHGLLASALRRVGRAVDSRREAERAQALIDETGGRPVGHPVLDGYLALTELAVADWDEAMNDGERTAAADRADAAVQSLDAYRQIFPIGRPAWHRAVGDVTLRHGNQPAAIKAFRAALTEANRLDMWSEAALSHAALARSLAATDPARVLHAAEARAAAARAGLSQMVVGRGAG